MNENLKDKKPAIYLDNNAIKYVFNPRKEKYDNLFSKLILSIKEQLSIPYSTAHLRDLFKNWNTNIESKDLTYKDLHNIQNITKGYHVYYDDKNIYFVSNTDVVREFKNFTDSQKNDWKKTFQSFNIFNYELFKNDIFSEHIEKFGNIEIPIRLPEVAYQQLPYLNNLFPRRGTTCKELITNSLIFTDTIFTKKDDYKRLRNSASLQNLHPKKSHINSINSLSELNSYISSIGYFKKLNVFSFLDFIEYINSYMNNENSTNLLSNITNAYILLDMLGIHKEKITKSNLLYNIFTDSMHLFFGALTKLIITEDKGLLKKGPIIFELYNIPTKILSISDFIIQRAKIEQINEEKFEFTISF